MRKLLLIFWLPLVVFADDSAYENVRDHMFWPQLYEQDYEGLYCGRDFPEGHKITAELRPAQPLASRAAL